MRCEAIVHLFECQDNTLILVEEVLSGSSSSVVCLDY